MVASVLIVNDTKCDWLRTVFYITYSQQSVVIVKQERDLKNLWQNFKDISLPFDLIDVVQLFEWESTQPNIALPYSLQQTPSYKKEFVYDVSMIQEPLRSLLYQYDLLEIPIYPNQEQSLFEVGFLNAYWGVKDPELPELNETQQESTRYNQENCDSGYSAGYSYPTFSLLNPPSESQHQPNQTRSQKQQQQQEQSTSSTTPFEQQQQQLVTPPITIISSSSSQPREGFYREQQSAPDSSTTPVGVCYAPKKEGFYREQQSAPDSSTTPVGVCYAPKKRRMAKLF